MDINVNLSFKNSVKNYKIDFILIMILAFATFLRLYEINFQSAWLDEISTLIMTDPKYSFKEFRELTNQREGIPDFYFILIKAVSFIFGHTIFVVRLVSTIAGVLAVYYSYVLAKELESKKAGYIAALLLTVNIFHIEHSQEGRSYAFIILFVIIAYYRLLLLMKNINLKNAIFLGLFTGLICNAHPIGLLNIISIYLSLLVFILVLKDKKQKIKLFKFSFYSGIVAFITFLPVYTKVSNASKIESFWIPKPTFNDIKSVFVDLLGRDQFLAGFSILLVLIYFILSIYRFFSKNINLQEKTKLSFIIFSIWLIVNIGVIIVKSYLDISMILARYFIGVLPAFILINAIVYAQIKNKIARYILLGLVVVFSLYTIFNVRKYYTTYTKDQFDIVTSKIIENNNDNDKIVSAYGWLLNYYLNKPNTSNIMTATFEDYVASLRNNATAKESFWYLDGHSRPYKLNEADEAYLNENFILDHDFNYYDAWAKHYIVKGEKNLAKNTSVNDDELTLKITQFQPFIGDGNGNLLIFENGKITSPEIELKPGDYELSLNANSLPDKPIKNQNAHVIIKCFNKEIAKFYLSENSNKAISKTLISNDKQQKTKVEIIFDNDISIDGLDRNVIIRSIDLKRK